LSKDSLEHLSERISKLLADESATWIDKVGEARRVCEYQFGLGAGEHLLPKGAEIKRYQLFYMGEQVAAINPADGLLALTLRGGEVLAKHGKYLVDISFEPKTGSVFCVGVEKAGEEIRPGDEVIVIYGGEVVGVGKALLNGIEMMRAEKGLALKLRHRR
jgi:archaeosine synthase